MLISPDDPVADAVALMREHAARRLPAEAHDPASALADISRAEPDARSGSDRPPLTE